MSFIKELQKQQAPFTVKGNLSDPYLVSLVRRMIGDRYSIIDIDEHNISRYLNYTSIDLFKEAKPECYVITDSELNLSQDDLNKFAKKCSIFIMPWSKHTEMGVPEITLPRLSMNSQTLSIVKEWSEYVGYTINLDYEKWKQMYRPGYEVLADVEKTLLAYSALEPVKFQAVIEVGGSNIQLMDLLKALLLGESKQAFIALERAWLSDISLERSLEWLCVKVDTFLSFFSKGLSLEDSVEKAKLTGLLKRLIEENLNTLNKSFVDRVWLALSHNNRLSGKAKDILILTEILGGV